MEFVGVGLDGTDSELDVFINDFGVGGFEQVSVVDDPVRVDGLLDEHGVNSIPYFVFVNDDGSDRSVVGWDEPAVRDELARLLTD